MTKEKAVKTLKEANRCFCKKWLRDEDDDPNAGKYYGDI